MRAKKKTSANRAKKAVPYYYCHRVSPVRKRKSRKGSAGHAGMYFKICFSLVVACAILYGVYFAGTKIFDFVKSDPIFMVSKVVVKNNWKVKTDTIGSMAKVMGRNIFEIKLSDVQKTLEGLVPIRRAVVRRHLPDCVEIIVFEREPFAYIDGKKLFVIDADGLILSGPLDKVSNDRLPVIKNINPVTQKAGFSVGVPEVDEMVRCLGSFYTSGVSSVLAVSEVFLKPLEGVVLELKSGERVVLGQGEYNKKMNRLKPIYEDLRKKHIRGAVIDLRFNDGIVKLARGK